MPVRGKTMYREVVERKQANKEYNLLVACGMPETTKDDGDIMTFGEWLKYKELRLLDPEDQKELDEYWATL